MIRRVVKVGVAVVAFVGTSAGQSPTSAPAAPHTGGRWLISTSRDEMTDQPSITLWLNALNEVSGPLGNVRPTLYVGCSGKTLVVFIATGAVLDGDGHGGTPVRIRWGSATPEQETWLRFTNYNSPGAFAPDAWAFLHHLVETPDMRFEFYPFAAAAGVARFDASGLDQYLPKFEEECPPSTKSRGDSEPITKSRGDSAPITKSRGDSEPSPGPTGNEVFTEASVDKTPLMLGEHGILHYPKQLCKAGIEGSVLMQAIIDTLGRVEPNSVKILLSSNPGFDEPAKAYLLQARFRPGRVHGRAVRVLINVPINFTTSFARLSGC